MRNLKHFGFSLAEVLVTMGIVGVLSIMLLPMMKNNYEAHVTEARTKAAYNAIMQATSLSKNAGSLYLGDSPSTWYRRYIQGNIQLAKDCGATAKCWHASQSLAGDNLSFTNIRKKYSFTMLNGVDVIVFSTNKQLQSYGINTKYLSDENEGIGLYFDINGEDLPNIIGQDIYVMVWNGKTLVPAGNNMQSQNIRSNCNKSATGSTSGRFCLQYMMDNGWKVNKELFE